MPRTYMRRPTPPAPPLQAPESASQGPSITELARGAAPTAAQMGRRVDLPGEIREKMEFSFGADFSGVRLFESDTVADAGAEAVAQGSSIAFAPGKLDFSSTSGQALLGHELSHIVSQARGESAGNGFLNDASLEAQADRQGMLAAQGESAFSGPVSPVSVSAASAASGPIQAKKQSTIDAEEAGLEGKELPGYLHPFQRSAAKGQWLQKRQERKTLGERAQRALDLDTPRDIAGSERMRQNLQAVLSSANAMRGGHPKFPRPQLSGHRPELWRTRAVEGSRRGGPFRRDRPAGG